MGQVMAYKCLFQKPQQLYQLITRLALYPLLHNEKLFVIKKLPIIIINHILMLFNRLNIRHKVRSKTGRKINVFCVRKMCRIF